MVMSLKLNPTKIAISIYIRNMHALKKIFSGLNNMEPNMIVSDHVLYQLT